MMKLYKNIAPDQVAYIMQNYKQKTAKDMADALSIEILKVRLICQDQRIEPLAKKKSRKPKDVFHQGKGFKKSYHADPIQQKVKRVPAQCTNTREVTINHYLNP